MKIILPIILTLLMANTAHAQTIVLVRHGQTEKSTGHLTDAGLRHRADLTKIFRNRPICRVLASHTLRTYQTVELVAQANFVAVEQFPRPGTMFGGVKVDDNLPRLAAVEPLYQEIVKLPPKCDVLVGVNSDNVYALLKRFDVPVPCESNKCFPDVYDDLWILVKKPFVSGYFHAAIKF